MSPRSIWKDPEEKNPRFQFPQVSFHCVCCDEDGQSWCIIYNAVGMLRAKGSKLKAREVLLQSWCCANSEEWGSHGLSWHHSFPGTAEALGFNRIILSGRKPILMKQDISQRHEEVQLPPLTILTFHHFLYFMGLPIGHILIMTIFLLQNKALLWPDFPLQLSSKVVLLSFTSFHAACTSSHLYSNPTLLSLLSNPSCLISHREMPSDQPQVEKAHQYHACKLSFPQWCSALVSSCLARIRCCNSFCCYCDYKEELKASAKALLLIEVALRF